MVRTPRNEYSFYIWRGENDNFIGHVYVSFVFVVVVDVGTIYVVVGGDTSFILSTVRD